MNNDIRDDKPRRWLTFRQLAPFYGKQVPASFLRNPSTLLPGIERVHPLIEGIYKPAWSDYALSIASMLKSPYADEINHMEGGHWWMKYSPKAGGMGNRRGQIVLVGEQVCELVCQARALVSEFLDLRRQNRHLMVWCVL